MTSSSQRRKNIDIRPFESENLRAAARLWMESYHSIGLRSANDAPLKDLEDRITEEIATDWDLYLGWDYSELVGFLALKPAMSCLDQIFVAPQTQGIGIGTELMDFAKEQMPDGMWLKAHADNRGAHRFYERHAFRRGETKTDPRFGYRAVTFHWP